MPKTLAKTFPFLSSIKNYNKSDFLGDLNAGLIVAVILIPQSIAYAILAGVPAIYGLYAALVPLVIYALLGTSRQTSMGPVAVPAILVFAGISTIAEPFTARYIELVIMTGILAGVFQLALGLLRMGWLVNFLSRPVIAGFSSAVALIIAVSQFGDVFGIEIQRGSVTNTIEALFSKISSTHWLTFTVAIGSFVILLILRKWNRKIPGALIITIASILLCKYLNWDEMGLDIIGVVPSGLPSFSLGQWSMEDVKLVLPTVLTIGILDTIGGLSIAKVLEARTKDHIIRPNQELVAYGASKILGGFFQGMPSTSSYSRSAISNESNSRTQVSALISVAIVLITLLFFTDVFYYLPKAVLAAIILQSVIGLFEWEEARHLWQVHKSDFIMMLATFIVTLVFGIEEGIALGVSLSILMVLYKSTKPHVAELGNIPNTPHYRNIERFEQVNTSDDLLILRFDDQLYYGNASFFKEIIREKIEGREEQLNHILLDFSNVHDLDSTGAHALMDIEEYLHSRKIDVHLCAVRGPHKNHMSVHAGVMSIKNQSS